jgi:hypothetical protein
MMAKRGRLPTMVKRDGRGSLDGGAGSRRVLDRVGMKNLSTMGSTRNGVISEQLGGVLNPDWCEAFMGFPKDWTLIEPQESNHSSENEHQTQSRDVEP